MRKIFSSLYGVIVLLFYLPASGQQYLFDHFTMADGLPSNTNYRCVSDSEGFIWIATSGGVARFDGKSFEVYHESDGLPDNDVTYLFVDAKNRVWFFGFNGGAAFYKQNLIHTTASDRWLKPLQTGSFVVYSFEDEQHRSYLVYADGTCRCITDRDSVILFPQRGNLFSGLHKTWSLADKTRGSSRHFLYSLYDSSRIQTPAILYREIIRKQIMAPAVRGNLFCGSSRQLYMASSKDLSVRKLCIVPAPPSGLKYLSDSSIALFAPAHGMYVYNLIRKKITLQLLNGETLTDALLNADGDLWCTSLNNGLFYLPACRRNAHYINGKENLPDERCTAVYADSNHCTWIGMDNTLLQLRKNNTVVQTHALAAHKNIVGRINSIVYSPAGYFGIASDMGMFLTDKNGMHLKAVRMYMADEKKTVLLRAVKSCSVAPNGDLLIAATNFAHRLPVAQMAADDPVAEPIRASSDRVLYAFEDSRRNTWIATLRGLIKITGKDTLKLYEQNEILSKRILQIAELRGYYIIIATDGAGLIALKDGKVLARIHAQNGLPSDICRRIFITGNTVYTATPEGIGIAGYNRQQGIFVHTVTGKDGLLNMNCRDVVAANDSLYVATDKGVNILSLRRIFKTNTVPTVYLKNITVDGRPVAITNNEVSFLYGAKSVQINYGSVSQNTTAGIEYRYRTAAQKKWMITQAPFLIFTDPALTQMQIIIQSRYKGGTWNKGLLLHIDVLPRFYQELWFILLVGGIILLILCGALFYIYRKRRLQVLTRNKLVKLESEANQAMMNPHFVFNALNSVQHFLNDHDNYSANLYLTRFSRLIRRHMELNRKQYLSLAAEFDFLKLYLELEKSRSDDRLSFDLRIQPGIDPEQLFIPVLLLQPLVENSVWHGIHPKGGGSVTVTAEILPENKLEITVTDDGVGFSDNAGSPRQSMGLSIIHDRLHLLTRLYGKPFSMDVQNMKTGGVRATVHFPLLKDSDLLYV